MNMHDLARIGAGERPFDVLAHRDPASLALAVSTITGGPLNLLAAGAIATPGAALFAGLSAPFLISAAKTALGVAISVAAQRLLTPKPKPTDSQREIRQAVPPRSFSYGRVKISGPLAWHEAKELPSGGDRRHTLFKIVLLSAREIDAIETIYLNDNAVTLDGDEVVTQPYVIGNPPRRMARLSTHLGLASQTADSLMLDNWPADWSADHRLDGIAYIVAAFEAPEGVNQFSEVYPAGEPEISALLRGAKVYDPRLDDTVPGGAGTHRADDPDTWEWSDNVALCILDYLTHDDGYARPIAKIDLASFMEMADVCDEPVALAVGGTEPRYRVATTVYLTEKRTDVLARLRAACDARIYQTSEGKWAIRGGRWEAPAVTLDSSLGQLLGYEMQEPSGYDRYNELVIQFLSPAHGYVEVECDPWRNEADIAATGEVRSQPLDLTQVPSYTQARRLAKIAMARDNPDWLISLNANFAAVDAIGEEALTLVDAEMALDEPMWIESGPVFGEDFTSASLQLKSASAAAYGWTTGEEGEAPAVQVPPTSEYLVSLDYSRHRNGFHWLWLNGL